MSKIDKKAITNFIQIFLLILFGVLIYSINKAFLSADDYFYKNVYNSVPTYLEWVQYFYTNVSARITIHTLVHTFVNLPLEIFKIANTLIMIMIVLLINTIVKLISGNLEKIDTIKSICILFSLIFLIDKKVLSSGAIWLCGAFNYLWPFAFMLLSIMPFIALLKGKEMKKVYYIGFILSNFISCFSEQCGTILLVFSTMTFAYSIYKKVKPSKLLICHYIVILLIMLFVFSAPGNSQRFYHEQMKWFPGFSLLSPVDKLVQGILNLANHLINDTNTLCLVLAITSSYLIFRNKEIGLINKIITLFPVIYIMASIALPDGELFRFTKFSLTVFCDYEMIFKIFIAILCFGTLAGELIYAFDDMENGLVISTLFCAGLCASLALSFSPTIFASRK